MFLRRNSKNIQSLRVRYPVWRTKQSHKSKTTNCKISIIINRIVCVFFLLVVASFAETYKIATYNVLNFPDAFGLQRLDDLKKVIDYIEPDILVLQEMQSALGMNLILDSIMNFQTNLFDAIPFNDGPDTDNGLFFRNDKLDFLSAQYLSTPNRDIALYRLKTKSSQKDFYLCSIHFKSSEGSTNEAIRLQEATILRNYLETLAPGSSFLVMGDFNIYYSDEPAFRRLTDSLANNNGRLFDPLNSFGEWHNNSSFAYLHTQSTRLEQLADGGSAGGLDDRFDMILCCQNLLDSAGLFLLKSSYAALGNDGSHFNSSINYGFNQSVPEEIADALYFASDHLPVFLNITDVNESAIPEEIVQIWPNPMEHRAEVRLPALDDFERAELVLTNILGQRVYRAETDDPIKIDIERGTLPIGIYFVHLKIFTKYNVYKYQTKLAIIE